jgi:hypothetical protein
MGGDAAVGWIGGAAGLGGMAPRLRRSGLPAFAAGGTRAGAPAGRARSGARLVELDERNVAVARQAARAAGLGGVEVKRADAGVTDACVGAVPAQIVVVCGIFGNISDGDIQGTVAALPSLCAPGALVLWTRHRRPPDLTPAIRSWFGAAGFGEEAFDASQDGFMSVGAHRLTGEPAALRPGLRLFTFDAQG